MSSTSHHRYRTAALAAAALLAAASASAEVTFYERAEFRGQSFSTNDPLPNFERLGYNDRASSAVVTDGPWEVCEDARFNGRCAVLHPGRYPNLAAMGLNDRISSVRPVDDPNTRADESRGQPAGPAYDARRRGGERLFQARVSEVRAVVGPPAQRCWVERGQVSPEDRPNVGGAIAGALLGGILGHQVGGGTGRDLATAGGAIAGAAVGSNVNRERGDNGQDVQRCADVDRRGQAPTYWDVTYRFRGIEHHVQMSSPPRATITVNAQGEPRV